MKKSKETGAPLLVQLLLTLVGHGLVGTTQEQE